MSKGKEEKKGKYCPIIGSDCIEDKCVFWTQVSMVKQVLGVPTLQPVHMCTFSALLLVMGSPKPQMEKQNINLSMPGGGDGRKV